MAGVSASTRRRARPAPSRRVRACGDSSWRTSRRTTTTSSRRWPTRRESASAASSRSRGSSCPTRCERRACGSASRARARRRRSVDRVDCAWALDAQVVLRRPHRDRAPQTIVVAFSGSIALLADTIHNFADAATALPLGVALRLARRGATRRFTYGLGRVEDLAGLAIVLTILASGLVAAFGSIARLLEPRPVEHLWAVVLASLLGFAGNEAVAVFRIRVGRQIGSAALVADGQHARVDG